MAGFSGALVARTGGATVTNLHTGPGGRQPRHPTHPGHGPPGLRSPPVRGGAQEVPAGVQDRVL